ncbi:hypothetical protein NMG60_11013836, partial [Bertholletia excelsa]
MEKKQKKLLCFALFLLLHFSALAFSAPAYSRLDFPQPPDFVFGSGTSAYQYEGAAFEDGRTPSIWDTFTHAAKMHGQTGDIACDGYHKYKEDVQLMVETGLEAYRFSISWSRLIPGGRGPVNPKGVEYYNNLINELVKHGIQPHVILTHIDIPQALEDEYDGWLCRKIFGDRVKHWTSVNEGNIFAVGGYDQGIIPPQRCSSPFGFNCTKGDSTTEPYIAAHHILLAHASVAKLYRKKYQGKQHGFIGMNLYVFSFRPYTNTTEDVLATQRANEFFHGWIINPLVHGDYPEIMKKRAGNRLPAFTKLESEEVKGSFDFVGLNYYNFISVKHKSGNLEIERDFEADMGAQFVLEQGGGVLPDVSPEGSLPVAPEGLVLIMEYINHSYGNVPIYVHENGQRTLRDKVTVNDTSRVEYVQGYIGAVLDVLRSGSNLKGYFYWSFMDLFELLDGYDSSYGLYFVDLDDLKRYPKLSANWYANFLKGESRSLDGGVAV